MQEQPKAAHQAGGTNRPAPNRPRLGKSETARSTPRSAARSAARSTDSERPSPTTAAVVRVRDAELDAVVGHPPDARGVVLFAHGTGSSRHSPRNRAVAKALYRTGFTVVLVDLLTAAEEREDRRTAQVRFDVDLLARRVTDAVGWLGEQPETAALPVGLFGASTGAAGALAAAAERADRVRAVVSRGGRPDLAGRWLAAVTAPTLLVVGALDHPVLELNREAAEALGGLCRVHVVPGAGHLFEEEGALDEVTAQAAGWFAQHLTGAPTR